MGLLNEVENFYDEYDGKGNSPKKFDLDDLDIRRRGKMFRERKKQVDERLSAFESARKKINKREIK